MPKKYDYNAVIKTVATILEETDGSYITYDRMARQVRDRLGLANASRVKVVLEALRAYGVFDKYTRWVRPTGKYKAQNQTTNTNTNNGTSIKDSQHRTEIRAMQEALKEAMGEGFNNGSLKAEFERFKDKTATDKIELLEKLKEAEKKANETRIVEIKINDVKAKKTRKMNGHFHQKFPRLLQLAKARKNIFIYGPTGSGKSHICGQIAEALNLSFAFVSCTGGMSEGVLGGRLMPVGKQGTFEYVISEFIKAYETGGVFLLDEIDAADPNVLLIVNAALANGRMAVPNRPEKPYAERHPDFICVAAANTVGTGADRMYSGRNKLDGATLDRFMIGKVQLDYDRTVEESLCPDEVLRKLLWKIRDAINEHRLERAMSTRFMIDACDMKSEGWSHDEIFEAFFCGWREDEVNKVKSSARI